MNIVFLVIARKKKLIKTGQFTLVHGIFTIVHPSKTRCNTLVSRNLVSNILVFFALYSVKTYSKEPNPGIFKLKHRKNLSKAAITPFQQYPNDEEFGHYLAGLIDGDGHYSTRQQLTITFHEDILFLAYYLKFRL